MMRYSPRLTSVIDLERNLNEVAPLAALTRGPVEYKMYSVNTPLFKQLPLDTSLFASGVTLNATIMNTSQAVG